MVEQRTENPCVPGSIPGDTTKSHLKNTSSGFFIEMYFVYVLYSDSKSIKYTGYTSDIELRLFQHNNGLLGKFTKGKGPWRIIYLEEVLTIEAALIREKYLKSGVGREFVKSKTGY